MALPVACIVSQRPFGRRFWALHSAAIVCRWESQTSKGIMWRDIGLGDWLFDFDQENEVRAMPEAVLTMAKEREKACLRAIEALGVVNQKFDRMMTVLKDCLLEGNIKK
jgi:hypothetical protein